MTTNYYIFKRIRSKIKRFNKTKTVWFSYDILLRFEGIIVPPTGRSDDLMQPEWMNEQ